MNTVERIKALCKERKTPVSRLEKELGFANGYIGQLKKGTVPNDRLMKIANFFNVSPEYLTTGKEVKQLEKEIMDRYTEIERIAQDIATSYKDDIYIIERVMQSKQRERFLEYAKLLLKAEDMESELA